MSTDMTFARQGEPYQRCDERGLLAAYPDLGFRPDQLECWLPDAHAGEHWDTEHELMWRRVTEDDRDRARWTAELTGRGASA